MIFISILSILLLTTSETFSQISITSSGGTTTPTTYTTLKSAFDAINVGTHTGVINITVNGNTTETSPCVLNASGTGTSSYTRINMSPSGGLSRTISGAIAAGSPLIDLNGADSVTINGIASLGGDSLIFSNTTVSTTSGTTTIRFIGGAKNNIITNCTILSSSTSSTSGAIFISTDASTTGTGNDFNTISNNIISNATGTSPRYGIYSSGTTAKENDNLLIANNNINNFYSSLGCAGVYLTTNTISATIQNNNFYQTSNRAVSGSYYGIYVSNTNGNFNITGNYIGGSEPFCLGLPTKLSGSCILQAIYINASASVASNIQGNKISNIEISTTSTSIVQSLLFINAGKVKVGDVTGNTFGDDLNNTSINYTSTPTSTTFSVIGYGTGTHDTILIKNNAFSGITIAGAGGMSLRGIDITGSTAKTIIDNNIFGSLTTSNSLNQLTNNSLFCIINRGSTAGFVHQITNNKFANLYTLKSGLRALTTGGATSWNVSNNEIFNLSSSFINTTTGTNSAIIGITSSSTGALNQTISNNKIYKLYVDGATASSIVAIICTNTTTGTNKVERNIIHSLGSASTQNSYLVGILAVSGNYTYANNMIRLGIDDNGVGIVNSCNFMGIYELAGSNNYYYNSVYIGGSSVVSVLNDNTYAYLSTSTTGLRNLYNNIFANQRNNLSGSGIHFILGTATTTGTDVRNNDYWSGSNFLAQNASTTITSLANYKSVFTLDTFSVSVDPNFVNSDGAINTLDLHILSSNSPSYLESAGRTISGLTTDFDNDVRPGPVGSIRGGGTLSDIGADEFDGAPLISCTTPIAGITVSSDSISCNGNNIILSLSGSTTTGNTNIFQWEKSTNGINYTEINGANTNSFVVSSLTSNTYYRCKINCPIGQSSDTSLPCYVKVSTLSLSNIANDTICGPGIATLSATTSNGIINWYDNLSASTPIATGTQFTTPFLSASKTYYIEAEYLTCKTLKTPIRVEISSLPIILSKQGDSSCTAKSFTLTASADKGILNWYSSPTSTTLLFSGNTFNTPIISSTTTYYVEASNNSCLSLTREAVVAKIIATPSITSHSAYTDTLCGGQSLKIFAKSSTGIIKWYNSANASSAIFTGDTLTFTLTSDTSLFAEAWGTTCVGNRAEFKFNLLGIPRIDSVKNNSGCSQNAIVLNAYSASGTVKWYSSLQSNVVLAQGSTFTTPVLTATTKYYVTSSNLKCESNRVEVSATINNNPNVTINRSSDTLFTNQTFASYEWFKNNISIPNSNSNKIKASGNGTYKVQVTDVNACTNFSNELIFNGTGIENTAKSNGLLYPNPSSTLINFVNIKSERIQILDLQGRIVVSQEFSNSIDIRNLTSGVYFIKFIDSNNLVQEVHKFIKMEK